MSGVDADDQSGQGGGTFPPRSKPYPMKGLPNSYFFNRASEMLAKGGYHPLSEPNGRASQPYGGRPTCAGNNNCNPVCPIGAKYDGSMHIDVAEKAGAKLLENAVVYRIEVGSDKKISAVHYKHPDGAEHRLTARYFVLAAHAIESPKLLLMSTSADYPNGVANSSDMVGRNLMDNTGISMSMMAHEDMWPGQGPTELLIYLNSRDGEFRKDFPSYKTKVRNTVPTAQLTASLIAKGVLGSQLDEQIRLQSARGMNWAVDFEMLPLPQNRVTPDKKKTDALGLPVPSIYYSVDDYWNAGRDVALKDLQRMAGYLEADVKSVDVKHQNRQHIMGTTIMGADPRDSVVDADCRTHDHANLFIAGCSVMPSVGCVNPTLTGAALSIRIADTLLKEI